MSGPEQPPTPDRLTALLEAGAYEEAAGCLDRLGAADVDARKRALQAVRNVADERPGHLEGLATPLVPFLTDEHRAVRLTTAKLFVTLARPEPAVVRPAVDALAERLADDEEFYYVRARCAEALGYVAIDSPEAVADPETLADLRIGLSFDGPEVREKLAKALAHVALGDPDRLRHQVDSLAKHLDDDEELVRYHLCTALVVIACAHPENVSGAEATIRERLTDENPYVRGRAAEALGVLAAAGVPVSSIPDVDEVDADGEEAPSFLTDRLRFCRRRLADDATDADPTGIGTIESVRAGTAEVVEEMTTADEDECPHCGLALPDSAPPMCPRCGAPH